MCTKTIRNCNAFWNFPGWKTVVGRMRTTGTGNPDISSPKIQFRVAAANHREGPFNSPTQVFRNNPYLSQVSPTKEVETFLGTPGQVQVPGQEMFYQKHIHPRQQFEC